MSIDWSRHRREVHGMGRGQDYLKQIVYGGNDGIVTTFAIVAGFAGASAEGAAQIGALAVIVFGLANLLADAVSMGLGEFLSTRSERDVYLAQRRRQLRELRETPENERAELIQMLTERGLTRDDAGTAAGSLMKSPELVADFMMAYEIGLPDLRGARPATEGLWTFAAFTALGLVPLLPYFVLDPLAPMTFRLSVLATGAALTALGLLRWVLTRENPLRCIGETTLVGGICAAVAYAVGALVAG